MPKAIEGYFFFDGEKLEDYFDENSSDIRIFDTIEEEVNVEIVENINDTTPPNNMEIHIFPGVSNTYTLYEDDGVTRLHEQGYYILTSIDYNYMENNYTVIIRSIDGKSGIVPDKRNYKMVFRNTKKADEVTAYFNNEKIETYIWDNRYTSGNLFRFVLFRICRNAFYRETVGGRNRGRLSGFSGKSGKYSLSIGQRLLFEVRKAHLSQNSVILVYLVSGQAV